MHTDSNSTHRETRASIATWQRVEGETWQAASEPRIFEPRMRDLTEYML